MDGPCFDTEINLYTCMSVKISFFYESNGIELVVKQCQQSLFFLCRKSGKSHYYKAKMWSNSVKPRMMWRLVVFTVLILSSTTRACYKKIQIDNELDSRKALLCYIMDYNIVHYYHLRAKKRIKYWKMRPYILVYLYQRVPLGFKLT